MIHTILKKGFVTALSLGLFSTVYAADIASNVSGSIGAYIVNSSSTTTMAAAGEAVFEVTGKAGSWDLSASQKIKIDASTVTPDDQMVTLGNDSMTISFGRFSPYGVTLGGAYVTGEIDGENFYTVGKSAPVDSASDNLAVSLNNIGVTIAASMVGSNTVFGLIYGTTLGDLAIGAEVVSGSINKTAKSLVALACGYTINDSLAIALNFENQQSTTTSVVWVDWGLSKTGGLSLGYGTQGSNKHVELTYSMTMDDLGVYATYFDKAGTTSIGGGLAVAF